MIDAEETARRIQIEAAIEPIREQLRAEGIEAGCSLSDEKMEYILAVFRSRLYNAKYKMPG